MLRLILCLACLLSVCITNESFAEINPLSKTISASLVGIVSEGFGGFYGPGSEATSPKFDSDFSNTSTKFVMSTKSADTSRLELLEAGNLKSPSSVFYPYLEFENWLPDKPDASFEGFVLNRWFSSNTGSTYTSFLGIIPFFSIPVSDGFNDERSSAFSRDGMFVFWYLRQKF